MQTSLYRKNAHAYNVLVFTSTFFLGKELSQISKPCLCHSLQRIFWVPFSVLFTNGICEEERFLLELSLCGITCLLVLWAWCSVFCMESWGMERYSYFAVIFYSHLFNGTLNILNHESDVSKTCGKVVKALGFDSLPNRRNAKRVDECVCICHRQWIKIEGNLILNTFFK